MSHSQFHSIDLFILRHAWLNLWDKHMTTGRINQVTISRLQRWRPPAANTLYWPSTFKWEAFQGGRSLQGFEMPPHLKCSLICCSCNLRSAVKRTSTIQPATGTPYPQVSQVLGTDLPVRKTRITAFDEDYQRPAAPLRHAAVQVDPRVVIWRAGLAHRQSIHILQHCRHKRQKAQMSDFHRWSQVYIPLTHLAHLTPNQHTPTCRSINDLVLKQPAYPQIGDILGSCPFLSPIWTSVLRTLLHSWVWSWASVP